MGRRSRKARTTDAPPGRGAPRRDATGGPAPAPARRRRSGEERNAEVRAGLEPLAPGERPTWVTVAAIAAAVLAVANLVLVLAGFEVSDTKVTPLAGAIGSAVLGAAAAGMWRARYWAVLGFEALLGLTALQAFVSLMVASNIQGAILALAVLAATGFLFYKLIRAMARIQMPRRPEGAGGR